jgi:ribosomal protein L37AE/L43A
MKLKVKVMSKLNAGRCDFCFEREAVHTINGGLWWICKECMNRQFGGEEE